MFPLRLIIASLALTLVAACDNRVAHREGTPSPSAGPAAAVQSTAYSGVGTVKALNRKAPSIEIDHGDIEGLMPAMQMEFQVTDPELLNGLAVNDRIDFTIENGAGGLKVTAIKKK